MKPYVVKRQSDTYHLWYTYNRYRFKWVATRVAKYNSRFKDHSSLWCVENENLGCWRYWFNGTIHGGGAHFKFR